VKERAHLFGSHGGLVGVTTEPDGGALPGAPAVLLFNVGLNHRVGPGRLNVDLARSLAALGVASLRFDVSGLGDSEPRSDVLDDVQRQVLDLREAMDFAEKKLGARRFVPVGLCSGTDGVHGAALADPRVAGAAFLDGYAYETRGYRLRALVRRLARLRDPVRWRIALRRRWRRLRGLPMGEEVETGAPEPIFDRTYPPAERFRADLEALLARNVKLLFVYTSEAFFFNHRDQFVTMVGWRALPAGVEVDYWPEADHVFRTLAQRRRAVERITAWVRDGLVESPARQAGAA
jgi:hypothetical protein